MRTLLICHEKTNLDREGLARWLASFSNLVGIVILRETRQHVWRRLRREFQRVGMLRFFDVLAFRIYYGFLLAQKDHAWEKKKLEQMGRSYALLPENLPVLHTHSPNSPEAEQFLERLNPDIVLARCKFILKERIFRIARKGTFVLHPGICPEYRNAHGCFWALVNRDLARVGMTLLQTDAGVDTGPVYGYYSYPYDELNESHVVIQHRAVLDNLIPLQNKFMEIYSGSASRVDTSGRNSAIWGQPRLTHYLKWKSEARKKPR